MADCKIQESRKARHSMLHFLGMSDDLLDRVCGVIATRVGSRHYHWSKTAYVILTKLVKVSWQSNQFF